MKVLIYGRNKINNTIHTKVFSKWNNEVTVSSDIETLKEFLFEYRPDIFITHIHTTSGHKFEPIRNLTKQVRSELPKCFIVITLHPSAFSNMDYQNEYLKNYSYDVIADEQLWHLKMDKDAEPVTVSSYDSLFGYECILAMAEEKIGI